MFYKIYDINQKLENFEKSKKILINIYFANL